MKGIAIEFDPVKGVSINPAVEVSGFAAIAQNGLVNLGTAKNSDPMWPARGTDIYKVALSGQIIDLAAARHVSNFAALSTRTFLIEHEDAAETDSVAEVVLSPVELDYLSLRLEAQFVSDSGLVIGKISQLPTNG